MVPEDYAALLLELSEFLNRRNQDARELTEQERYMLKRAIEFIQRVKIGHEVFIQPTGLVADLLSLNAYDFAARALPRGSIPLVPNRNARMQLFADVGYLLTQIDVGHPLIDLPPALVAKARELFTYLVRFAFSQVDEDELPDPIRWERVLNNSLFSVLLSRSLMACRIGECIYEDCSSKPSHSYLP